MELIPGLPEDVARECLVRVSHRDFPRIASTCREWRAEIRRPEFSRRRRAVGSTQTLIVFAQARVPPDQSKDAGKFPAAPTYRLTALEPSSGEWSEIAPGIGDRLPMFSQIARVGSELMVIGGWDPTTWTASNAVFLYDFVSATWRRGKDMPGEARSFFACAADQGGKMVYVAGGHDEQKNALKSAIAYDVAANDWTEIPNMAEERDECRGIFLNGKFLAVGGYATEAQGRFGPGAEEFDPVTWRWGPVEEGFLGEVGICPRTCVGGRDGKVYRCIGGEVAVREGDTWRRVAELPAEAREAACAVTWRGGVLVVGSARFGGPHSAFVLDLERRSWQRIAVPEEFSGHAQSGCCLEL